MAAILEGSDHSRIAVYTCVVNIIHQVVSGNIAVFGEEVPLHIWSDGCAAKFRSRFVFYLIARMKKQFVLECNGKGAMDGVRGAIKNKVYRNIKSGEAHIKGVESFDQKHQIIVFPA